MSRRYFWAGNEGPFIFDPEKTRANSLDPMTPYAVGGGPDQSFDQFQFLFDEAQSFDAVTGEVGFVDVSFDGTTHYLRAYGDTSTLGTADTPWTRRVVTGLEHIHYDNGVVIGQAYAGTEAPPANGLIVQDRVGIGVAIPNEKLDVDGTVQATDFQRQDGQPIGPWKVNASGIHYNGGDVGINTTSPTAELQVAGTIKATKFDAGTTKVSSTSIDTWSLNLRRGQGTTGGYFRLVSTSAGLFNLDHSTDFGTDYINIDPTVRLVTAGGNWVFSNASSVGSEEYTVPTNTSGWKRIADSGGGRSVGQFQITVSRPGQHANILIYAGMDYGQSSRGTINVLGGDFYTGALGMKARIVHGGVSDNMYLELYASNTSSSYGADVKVKQFFKGDAGWDLITPTAGSVPSGFSTFEQVLHNTSFAVGSEDTGFRVVSTGTYIEMHRELRLYDYPNGGVDLSNNEANLLTIGTESGNLSNLNVGKISVGNSAGTPSDTLELHSNLPRFALFETDTSDQFNFSLQGGVATLSMVGTGGGDISIDSSGNIAIAAGTGANVGVGTSSPTAPFEVHGLTKIINPASSPTGSQFIVSSPGTGNGGSLGLVFKRGDGSGGVSQRWDIAIDGTKNLRYQNGSTGNVLFDYSTSGTFSILSGNLEMSGGSVLRTQQVMFSDEDNSGYTYRLIALNNGTLQIDHSSSYGTDFFNISHVTNTVWTEVKVGVKTSSPSHSLEVVGDIGRNFVEGRWGDGYLIDENWESSGQSYMEIDNLRIRGSLIATTFEKEKVKVLNGFTFFNPSSTLTEDIDPPNNTYTDYTIYVKEGAFQQGDLLLYKDIAERGGGLQISEVEMTVQTSSINGTEVTRGGESVVRFRVENNTTPPLFVRMFSGGTITRVGNTSDAARQGGVFVNTEDADSPFIDIYDNLDSWADWNSASGISSLSTLEVRLGDLAGLTSSVTLPGQISPSGYGLYSENVFLKGAIVATEGRVDEAFQVGESIYMWDRNATSNPSGHDEIRISRDTTGTGTQNFIRLYQDVQTQDGDWGIEGLSNGKQLFHLGDTGTFSGLTIGDGAIRFDDQGDAFIENTLEMGTGGEITNTNSDFRVDKDGFTVFRSASYQRQSAFTVQDGTTDYGAMYVLSGGGSDLNLKSLNSNSVRVEADGGAYSVHYNSNNNGVEWGEANDRKMWLHDPDGNGYGLFLTTYRTSKLTSFDLDTGDTVIYAYRRSTGDMEIWVASRDPNGTFKENRILDMS